MAEQRYQAVLPVIRDGLAIWRTKSFPSSTVLSERLHYFLHSSRVGVWSAVVSRQIVSSLQRWQHAHQRTATLRPACVRLRLGP